MNRNIFRSGKIVIIALMVLGFCFSVADVSAQGTRRKRTPTTTARTNPVTQNTEPQIISRAQDFPDTGTPLVLSTSDRKIEDEVKGPDENSRDLAELRNRVKSLETGKKDDQDQKQKRLMLNLDILTKAEQRADSLRKQLFEMIEKESTIRTKLDLIENNIRPEAIDREIAFAGTLRPEDLRNMRKKNLEVERTNLQSLLVEVQKTKSNIDQTVQKADILVDRLRVKLEKEIDDALTDEPVKP